MIHLIKLQTHPNWLIMEWQQCVMLLNCTLRSVCIVQS